MSFLFVALLSLQLTTVPDLAALEELAFQDAVEAISPSVVQIETIGGQERVGRMLVGTGPTTGLIASADGYIISSAFNFVQKPTSILVTLPSGTRRPARIVSRDRSRMLVLLKIDVDEELPVPVAASNDEMRVGQWVIALGRTFAADQASISVGILSAKDRIWGRAIQTDANVSPSNYGGPLIDLEGRVLGVLVPLSPEAPSEVAGVQWYDSGIGFAIPWQGVLERLPQMIEGPLRGGLLGVTLKGNEIYATAAIVAACRIKSPAYEAGIRAGDVIVECNGQSITRQAQLKHVLGPLYAGEQVRLRVRRGEEELQFEVELVDELVPYVRPFLGILPSRGTVEGGVEVRFVFAGSGAEAAGLLAGDRIQRVGGEPLGSEDRLRAAIMRAEVGDQIELEVERDGAAISLSPQLSEQPEVIPEAIPDLNVVSQQSDAEIDEEEVGEIEVTIPEHGNECFAYVPKAYQAGRDYALIAVLSRPGESDRERLLKTWRPLCDKYDLILVAPQPSDPTRWQPTEVQFVKSVIEQMEGRYRLDPMKSVLCGRAAGGAMAYFSAFRLRDRVRGVVAIEAAIPRRMPVPEADPESPLAFLSVSAEKSPLAARIEASLESLRAEKHPVTKVSLGAEPRALNASELEQVARWINTLDRI